MTVFGKRAAGRRSAISAVRRAAVALVLLGATLVTSPTWADQGAEAGRPLDVRSVLSAVVEVNAEIPETARTADFLGTARSGTGMVIDDDGLVLTIGYIILEAMAATVIDSAGVTHAAEIVAYDYDTGFGLLRSFTPLAADPVRLGRAAGLSRGDPVLAVGFGGIGEITAGTVSARKPFVGYWEYLLDSAIYVMPAHPSWAGVGLLDRTGRLVGIGSIRSREAGVGNADMIGTMFVPIDLLPPILGDLLTIGRAGGPAKPWLGMFTSENDGHVRVTTVVPDGPADRAGIAEGDIVLGVGDTPIGDRANLFREIWARGEAGVPVPLVIGRGGGVREITVRSADRYDYLRLDPSF